ncbi:hypothetical protein DCS_00134 [Drechmeria coniospora]|uniref:F-box domain-containing protein n=1 Tax=Drechmeria coniospora TaxID=98403 RepID=A0A151GPH1_DRECN|nr:hypothetical protein DCS_00134 [Drechmeria coniospora]KYK59007.1 hypothetical protein DCS_00134 [Drechmeria coniospora]
MSSRATCLGRPDAARVGASCLACAVVLAHRMAVYTYAPGAAEIWLTPVMERTSAVPLHLGQLFVWLASTPANPTGHTALFHWRPFGFVFHAACWDMLGAVAPPATFDRELVFAVLTSFPQARGLIQFGHGYGGLHDEPFSTQARAEHETTSDGPLEEKPWPVPGPERHDPHVVAEIRRIFSLLRDREPRPSPASRTRLRLGTQTAGRDPFRSLPDEVLRCLVHELASPDVVSLRRASRALAGFDLPDSFFHSRFRRGRELQHVIEAQRPGMRRMFRGRWKSIYLGLKALSREDGMRNRARVWRILGWWCDVLAQIRDRHPGDSCIAVGDAVDDADVDGSDVEWVAADHVVELRALPCGQGVKPCNISLFHLEAEFVSAHVSVVRISGRCWVSGVCFETADGYIHPIHTMGHLHPSQSHRLDAGPDKDAQPEGFLVAHDGLGVRGIAILYDSGHQSNWVGDHAGVPVRKLVLPRRDGREARPLCWFRGAFDGLKMISLAISDGHKAGPRRDTSRTELGPSRDNASWFPRMPPPNVSFEGIDLRDLHSSPGGQGRTPFCIIMFRELSGSGPGSRLRIEAHHGRGGAIVGLSVAFVSPAGSHAPETMGSREAPEASGSREVPEASGSPAEWYDDEGHSRRTSFFDVHHARGEALVGLDTRYSGTVGLEGFQVRNRHGAAAGGAHAERLIDSFSRILAAGKPLGTWPRRPGQRECTVVRTDGFA